MDPFSAAASGIAVVSLAIQLVDSVREIQRFLRNVSEAPKELKRLLDLLEHLELILENIGAQMAKQQRNSIDLDDTTITSVQKAMKMCEDKLLVLEGFVKRAKKASEARNKATRAVGAFKLACKKKDIEEFESQLQQAIHVLNLTMTINLTSAHLLRTDMILNELALFKSPVCLTNGSSESAKALDQQPYTIPRQPGVLISRRQSTNVFWYQTPFGRLGIRRKLQYTKFDGRTEGEVATSSETSWIFTPSFLNRCMAFRSMNVFGSIERSFRVWQVIPTTHPVWELCEQGNLVGVQSLLTSRAVSPFSIDEYGETLLHHGASHNQFKVCELLLGLGFTGDEENNNGNLPIQKVRIDCLSSTGLQKADSTLRLLASKLSTTEIPLNSLFLAGMQELETLRLALDTWITPQNVKRLRYALIRSVRSMWGEYKYKSFSPYSRNDRKFEIGRLIHVGADIHSVSKYEHKTSRNGKVKTITDTLLDEIMRIPGHTFDSNILLNEWLDTLRKAGLDVAEYLRVETEHHGGDHFISSLIYGGKTYEIKILMGEKEEVLCDRFFDPSSHAFDALHEFRHFGNNIVCHPSEDSWPYPVWEGYKSNDSAIKLQHQRFERRAYKKALKLARMQGLQLKGPKFPGSWID